MRWVIYLRKALGKLLVELLLHVTGLDVFDDGGDVGGEGEEGAVLAGAQPPVQGVGGVGAAQGLEEGRAASVIHVYSWLSKVPGPRCSDPQGRQGSAAVGFPFHS